MLSRCACPGGQRCTRWIPNGWRCPQMDDEMMRAILMSMDSASAAAQRTRSQSPSAAPQECIICFETRLDGVNPIGCSAPGPGQQRHFICADCVPMYVTSELEITEQSHGRLEERRKCDGRLRCPHLAGDKLEKCSGYLAGHKLERLLPPEVSRRYSAARLADNAHRQWIENHRNETDPSVIREGLLREFPDARQCRQCERGPIEIQVNCGNLNSHHGEWKRSHRGGWAQVLNQCPNCGWWAPYARDWPAWDGMLHF
jgi:hypothetical protein